MHAIYEYGYLIHEFDPWFHYRATEYLSKHGVYAFFHWFDYMSWYPLGRPVGTTIYPGMQMAAVAIHRGMKQVPKTSVTIPLPPSWLLAYLPKYIKFKSFLPGNGVMEFGPMSLNDVCCMVPPWFGSLATLLVALLTYETSGSSSAAVISALVMAIIPAHLMRSVGGGYDNESVATAAFCLVFWLWCRSIRTQRSWPIGVFSGLAYVFAVSAWGGYIFVNNLVGLHAAIIVVLGKYNSGIYRAYSLWYVVGTAGATMIPAVGWTPLKSLEQMPALLVFLVFQVLELCDAYRRRQKGSMSAWKFFFFRVGVFACAGLVVGAACFFFWQLNYFAPLGARIRGLFLKHQKTGNPLVDSVAEHQASTDKAYDQYLGQSRYVAVFGLLFCWHQKSASKYFPVVFALVAYHFSLKMSRLMIICGPIVSILAGYPLGIFLDWGIEQVVTLICGKAKDPPPEPSESVERTGGMGSIIRRAKLLFFTEEMRDMVALKDKIEQADRFRVGRMLRIAFAVTASVLVFRRGQKPVKAFIRHCEDLAPGMSHPSLVWKAPQRDGSEVMVTDYVDGYKWVAKNTPKDSRVMAWWDYGYQITGIAKRTSIADGNTWNHEHIATLGRILTSPEKKAHKAMVHLTDYVLVWAGGGGDDMGKSPHLARIANSVFPDVCGNDDPTCNKFGFYQGGEPTPMMAQSFLYKAVMHNLEDGIRLAETRFQEVHTTKHGLMRVFKVVNVSAESKEWISKNRVCDAPGSWYCVGQYPPALQPLIAKRKNFAQLEDFNKKKGEKSAYTKMVEAQQKKGAESEL